MSPSPFQRISPGVQTNLSNIFGNDYLHSSLLTQDPTAYQERASKYIECRKTVSHVSALRNHQIIYSDEILHKCDICVKVFSTNSHLAVPQRIIRERHFTNVMSVARSSVIKQPLQIIKEFILERNLSNVMSVAEALITPQISLLLLLLLIHFSRVRLSATPQTAAHQALPSLRFSRQEHWSGLPCPPLHESEK